MYEESGEDEAFEVWPALTDLLAASAMIFLVLLAVLVFRQVQESNQTKTLHDDLIAALRRVPNQEQLFTIEDDAQLVRIVLREDVTFPSKGYTFDALSPEGIEALKQIGHILRQPGIGDKYQQVVVQGHTDQVPFNRGPLTNWELSSLRAAAVVRLLVHDVGVDPCRITASGAGPFFPAVAPNGVRDRRENRRIEIVILPAMAQRTATTGDSCYANGDGSLGPAAQ